MDSAPRLARVRAALSEQGIDGIAVMLASNVDYVTGFDGIHDEELPHVAFITADDAVFLTDSRYTEVSKAGAAGGPWRVIEIHERMVDELKAVIDAAGCATVAFEDLIPYRMLETYRTRLAGHEVRAIASPVEKIRYSKSVEELDRIARAQACTDAAFTHICSFIRPGMTEKEIQVELEHAMLLAGAEKLAFATIIASGPNGALPHCVPGERRVQSGDFITMDFGAQFAGYKSDMTRTVAVGTLTDEQRRIYATVLAANEAGEAAVHAGATGKEVDKAARDVIEAAGYGKNFGHGLGHGVGLDIHEGPSNSPRSTDTLQAGDVVTIEPGIYVAGLGGVRIEDLVVVEDGGVRVLTASPKELIVIDA